MNDFTLNIDKNKLPQHVAIIMDGNGRWAKQRNQQRFYGHQQGVNSVRNVCEIATEIGIKYLTLYTFSKENWARPKEEVDALMQMLLYHIINEEQTFMTNQIRLQTIGDIDGLAQETKQALLTMMDKTKNNTKMTLVLALNYSAKWEIVEMVKGISKKVKDDQINISDIDENMVSSFLTTKNMPDVDLLIRTSGEERISNFMLWQIAYAELYFTDVLWPDFSKQDFCQAIADYQKRERRYGKTTEQISQ